MYVLADRADEYFVARLQCQNNMKLVFRISEDDSEINYIKHWLFGHNYSLFLNLFIGLA